MFICKECGEGSASWMGRCPNCGAWNSFAQRSDLTSSGRPGETEKLKITNLGAVKSMPGTRLKSGIFEFDRVTGGGLLPGEVVLLTGEPGVGKSTLLLQVLSPLRTLYISGEEGAQQIHDRAQRLKVKLDKLAFSDTLQIEGIIAGVEESADKYDVLVLDSIQTIYSKDAEGAAGSVGQIRQVTQKIVTAAKQNNIAVILIGHVTKEGDVAGPKTLEHYVDCVMNFEGEKVSNFRILRAVKNRFGPTSEIGVFEMREGGLHEVTNPLAFLEEGDDKVAGRTTSGVAEGVRPLFFEIQSLTVSSSLASPRRVVRGVNYNKVQLLLAVLQKHLSIPVDRYDVFVNVVGGIDIKSPSSDLALVASVFSAFKNIPVSKQILFTGEVGLLGEVRPGAFEAKIINEAKRLKFKQIYSSKNLKNIRELPRIIR